MTTARKLFCLFSACVLICVGIVLMLRSPGIHPQTPARPVVSNLPQTSARLAPASPSTMQTPGAPVLANAIPDPGPAVDPQSMDRFSSWVQRYLEATPAEQQKLLSEGI